MRVETMHCWKCGETNPSTRTTCRSCFAILRQQPGPKPEVCRQCRAVSPTGSAFCTACGAPVHVAPVPPNASAPPVRPARQPAPPATGAPPAADADEGEFALSSRIVLAFGGFWTTLGWVLLVSSFLGPVVMFKFEVAVSAAFFYGWFVLLHLLEQVWVVLDLLDRGGPKWWLAVTAFIPVGLALYMLIERSDA